MSQLLEPPALSFSQAEGLRTSRSHTENQGQQTETIAENKSVLAQSWNKNIQQEEKVYAAAPNKFIAKRYFIHCQEGAVLQSY